MSWVPSDAQHQQHAPSRDPTDPAPEGIGPGTILDERYRLSGSLGWGGTATVYRATDVLLGRSVAVKVFHPHLTDPTVLARQRREMRVAAEVHHSHLVTIHDARVGSAGHATDPGGTDRAQPSYLVMEFVDGPSLAQRLTGAPLSPDEVNGIGVGIAGALQVLHARDLVHRDVKPGNILLTSTGLAKLSGFGIAKMLHAERVTNSADVVGTAAATSAHPPTSTPWDWCSSNASPASGNTPAPRSRRRSPGCCGTRPCRTPCPHPGRPSCGR